MKIARIILSINAALLLASCQSAEPTHYRVINIIDGGVKQPSNTLCPRGKVILTNEGTVRCSS
jgi:hypothetical protein